MAKPFVRLSMRAAASRAEIRDDERREMRRLHSSRLITSGAIDGASAVPGTAVARIHRRRC
jgi:hypothetical protein